MASFAGNLSDEQLHSLFTRYTDGRYGHLMRHPIVTLTSQQERSALVLYLDAFAANTPKNKGTERRETLSQIMGDNDFIRLRTLLICDQYFEETLFAIANRATLG